MVFPLGSKVMPLAGVSPILITDSALETILVQIVKLERTMEIHRA